MLLFDTAIFSGAKLSACYFVHLETEQVELLGVGFLVHDQVGLFLLEFLVLSQHHREPAPLVGKSAERIQDMQLAADVQKRLVVVCAVNI